MDNPHIKSAIWVMGLSLILVGGCAELHGTSVKTYQLEYQAAVQASADALEDLEIYILDEVSDRLRTEILARHADGNPVRVEVKRVDRNFTQVAVSSGAGVDRILHREVSDQIHEFIRKQLVTPSKDIKWPE